MTDPLPPHASTRQSAVARGLTTWPASPPRFDEFGDDDASTNSLPEAKPSNDDLGGWIDRLTAAGVRAARQNSPDLIAQLNLAIRRPIDKIICSVLDVDPSACVQSAAAATMANELVTGLRLVRSATRATDAMIVVDARVPRAWWSALRTAVKAAGNEVRIVEIGYAYPQADPSLLLYTLINRRLRPRKLPGEAGAIVLDAIAAIDVGTVASTNAPISRRPLVVRDRDRSESYFVRAPINMTLKQLLERLEVSERPTPQVVRGGDLLRDQIYSDVSVAVRDLEAVLHVASAIAPINPESCIRCGWCFEACPTRVQPATLLEAAQSSDLKLAEHAGLSACIECGICSYVCPSRLPLLPSIRSLIALVGARKPKPQ